MEAPAPKKEESPSFKNEKVSSKSPVNIDFPALEKSVKDFLSQVFVAMQLEVEIITKIDEEIKARPF